MESSSDLEQWSPVPGVITNVVSTNGDFETMDLSKPGGWPPTNETVLYRLGIAIND